MAIQSLTPSGALKCPGVPDADGRPEAIWAPDWGRALRWRNLGKAS